MINLSKYNPKHSGRAFALVSVYGEQEEDSRLCDVPLDHMVLWEYAPGRTTRALERIDSGDDDFTPPDVIEYVLGDELYYVPHTHYHHIFAEQQRGATKARVLVKGIDTITPSRFYINSFGLWLIESKTQAKLVDNLASIQEELQMLLDMGIPDYR